MSSQYDLPKVTELLWQGRAEEASSEIDRIESKLSSREAEIKAENLEIALIREKLSLLSPKSRKPHVVPKGDIDRLMSSASARLATKEPASSSEKLGSAEKRVRSMEILELAKSIGAAKEKFTNDDVAKAIKDSDIKMGISEVRYNTAIGNILKHSNLFTVITKGVYELNKNEDLA